MGVPHSNGNDSEASFQPCFYVDNLTILFTHFEISESDQAGHHYQKYCKTRLPSTSIWGETVTLPAINCQPNFNISSDDFLEFFKTLANSSPSMFIRDQVINSKEQAIVDGVN